MDTLKALSRVPAIWSHQHWTDESKYEFDVSFMGCCETCRDRFEYAVDEGRACEMHPGALCNPETKKTPFWCEICEDEEKRIRARAEQYIANLQLEQIREGDMPLPAPMVAIAKRAYIDAMHEFKKAV